MFKMKYKMHRLVNIVFYGVFWVSGFLVGYGLKGGNVIETIKLFFTNNF